MQIDKYLLIVFALTLVSCGANTTNLSALHVSKSIKSKIDSIPESQRVYTSFPIKTKSILMTGVISNQKTITADSVDYQFYKLPLNPEFDFGIHGDYISIDLVFGLGQGYQMSVSATPYQPVQFHSWLSTWFFGNHKFGYGATVSPINNLVLGVGRVYMNGYNLHQKNSGLNFLPSYSSKSILETRNVFDILYNFEKFGIYLKSEFSDKRHFRAAEFGTKFQL
jgi:hypothetical protein